LITQKIDSVHDKIAHKTELALGSVYLPVPPQRQSVVTLPGLAATGSGLVVPVALVETPGLLASGSKTTGLAVLVDGVADPIDPGILANGTVLGVDQNDLVVLVGRVLVDPVRVQHTQVSAATANTLLSGGSEGALVLELVNSLVGGLAIGGTLGHWPLATTTADTDTVDNVALLSLVAETAGLVGPRRAGSTVDHVQLAVLETMHSQQMFNECHQAGKLAEGRL